MNKGYEVHAPLGDEPPCNDDGGFRGGIVATIHMFGLVPKGFIPSEDTARS